ncbi:hypothetical protein V1478_012170 [Vespula squamosa]|uniref:Uncharacterized protein n=1 Tax=Vespula squamosa TaxID=30214 RepID=A0ABD2ACF9_VESSQ
MIIKNILFKFIGLNSSQYINSVSFQCTTQFKKKKKYNYYIYEIYNLLLVMTVKLQLIDLPRAYLT